jgi:hypothetical protein
MTPSRWRQGSYRAKELWALGGPSGSRQLATVLGNTAVRSKDECDGKPVIVQRHVCQHLSLADIGKAYAGKPRSEPDPGNPAVRDRRGASGIVAKGAGLRAAAKASGEPTGP